MNRFFKQFIFSSYFFSLSILSAADFTIQKFGDVQSIVESLPKNTKKWLVLDLDESLLRTKTVFGSETFFVTQDKLLALIAKQEISEKDSARLVAKDFKELLRIQNGLLKNAEMVPVDDSVVGTLKDFGSRDDVDLMILTSRGPDNLPETARELERQNLPFGKWSADVRLSRNRFLPYDPANLGELFKEGEDPKMLGLDREPKPVLFSEGVFLTEGQNKGLMMRVLYSSAVEKPAVIIFVDNTEKHLDRAEYAAKRLGVELISVLYKVPTPFYSQEDIESAVSLIKERLKKN